MARRSREGGSAQGQTWKSGRATWRSALPLIVWKNSKIAGAPKISQMQRIGDFSRCKAL